MSRSALHWNCWARISAASFDDPVGRGRVRWLLVEDRHGRRVEGSVDVGTRDEDETIDACGFGRFEHGERALGVDPPGLPGGPPRGTDVAPPGEVVDHVGCGGGDELGPALEVEQIRSGLRRIVEIAPDRRVAGVGQMPHEVRTDESGRTGHKSSGHGARLARGPAVPSRRPTRPELDPGREGRGARWNDRGAIVCEPRDRLPDGRSLHRTDDPRRGIRGSGTTSRPTRGPRGRAWR